MALRSPPPPASPPPRNPPSPAATAKPVYEADETLVTLRFEHEFDQHTFVALAGYQDTSVLSQQGYNNDVGSPGYVSPLVQVFFPTTFNTYFADGCLPIPKPSKNANGIIGGHIGGCSNRQDGYDQSNQDTDQSTFEVHLASDYDGPFNFLVGAFYMEAKTENDFWVIATGLDYFSVVFPAVGGAFLGIPGLKDGMAYTAPSYVNRTDNYELDGRRFRRGLLPAAGRPQADGGPALHRRRKAGRRRAVPVQLLRSFRFRRQDHGRQWRPARRHR